MLSRLKVRGIEYSPRYTRRCRSKQSGYVGAVAGASDKARGGRERKGPVCALDLTMALE